MNNKEEIKEIMRDWFYANYELPVDVCPYDEGEYVYIWGGPYEAEEELMEKFGNVYDEEIIRELADELNNESWEWSGQTIYDEEDIKAFISSSNMPINNLYNNINLMLELLNINLEEEHRNLLYNMIEVNGVSILETFLYEEFSKRILSDEIKLESFFEKYKPLKEQKISLDKLIKFSKSIKEIALKQLNDMLWHNLPKVSCLYKDILEIDIKNSTDFEFLNNMVKVRHNVVHHCNCGKDKEGNEIKISRENLEQLFDEVKKIANHIHNTLNTNDEHLHY
jgi:hypothetical protein